MGTFTNTANDTGDWNSNKEMNPAANSSVTENGLLEAEDQEGEKDWRGADDHTDADEPGRTPGKAEGDVDADTKGNNS